MEEKAFVFSVIIRTEGNQEQTQKTFDSISQQNFFDQKIQVIFTGEANEAVSRAKADYPDNVTVAHEETSLSKALEMAQGKYCLVCREGEYVKYKSTFKKANKLFSDNKDKIDAVILKVYDSSGKGDFLNRKFENGEDIVDLVRNPRYIHTDLNGVFICKDALKSALSEVGEDNGLLVISQVLSGKKRYAVCEDRYVMGAGNKRSVGEICSFFDSLSGERKRLQKHAFFRSALVYELSKLTDERLSESDCRDVLPSVKKVVELLENKDISAFEGIDFVKRLCLLKVKVGSFTAKKKLFSGKTADSGIYVQKEAVGRSEEIPLTLYFVCASEGKISIEFSRGSVCGLYNRIRPVARLGDREIEVRENTDAMKYTSFLCENVIENRMFEISFHKAMIKKETNLRLGVECDGIEVYPEKLTFNPTCLLEGKYKHHYLYDDGIAFFCRGNEIVITPCDEKKRYELEDAFIGDIANSKLPDKDELISLRREYFIKKDNQGKPIWLISDRPSRAGDNGEVFFEYVTKNHSREVDAYFVLSKESRDYERVSAMGNVVEPLSYEHKLLFLLAEKNISAQADIYVTNPFGKSRRAVHDLMKSDFIFLQHGVIKDDLSDWLNRYKKNIKGFVTSSSAERDSITQNKNYAYGEDRIWLTGLPRFDRLSDNGRRIVTFMPTWRKYLVASQDSLRGTREFDLSFTQSEFFRFYTSVVNNERLLRAAYETGYAIAFLPHPNMVEGMHFFNFDKRVTVYDSAKSYGEVFAESSLLVTDYSSAVFDFVYMGKPVVYCQFDKEKFFSGEHNYTKGYFDYERDGFGEVEYTAEATVDRIIEYMQNGCRMKKEFAERADSFFSFRDKSNCERVYDCIRNNGC